MYYFTQQMMHLSQLTLKLVVVVSLILTIKVKVHMFIIPSTVFYLISETYRANFKC